MKRTPWFPTTINPVRKGLYECGVCCCMGLDRMHLWDGRYWRWSEVDKTVMSMHAGWRGLAEAPDDASKLPKEG